MERVELQCEPLFVMMRWPEELLALEDIDTRMANAAFGERACGTCGEYGHKPADCPEQNNVRWKETH